MSRYNDFTKWYGDFYKKSLKVHISTLSDTYLIVIYTFIPAIIRIFYNKLFFEKDILKEVYSDGSFLLYCFSFLTSAYIIYNNQFQNVKKYKNISNIILGTLPLLPVAYAIIDILKNMKINGERVIIDVEFIYTVSLWSCAIGLIIFYNAQLNYNKSIKDTDVGGERDGDSDTLSAQLS